jgi:hypothetical protein
MLTSKAAGKKPNSDCFGDKKFSLTIKNWWIDEVIVL